MGIDRVENNRRFINLTSAYTDGLAFNSLSRTSDDYKRMESEARQAGKEAGYSERYIENAIHGARCARQTRP